MNTEGPEFLDLSDVLELHAMLMARYEGAVGLRDSGLLESALAQPQATFDGAYLHGDLFSMAAAYLYHLVRNHPFVDGNKRTGLLVALVFLDLNGIAIDRETPELYDLTMGVAEGRETQESASATLCRIAQNP